MYEKKRLHPATIVFNFLQLLKDFFLPIIIGFLTIGSEGFGYFLIVTAIILIIFIPFSVLSWYRFTYQTTEEQLIIEQGVFIRKKRYISKNRIHSIDLTETLIHHMFKLVKVQIETAGSGDGAEVFLKAVSLKEGEELREQLKKTSQIVYEELPDHTDQITVGRLFIAGSTSGSIGVILAAIGFFFSQMEQFIPDSFYDETIKWIIGLSVIFLIGLIIFILFILWLLGIAGTMIKYGNFTITKRKEELFITRGLLEKKQITIPVDRIQAVGIDESIFRQPFGFTTVFVEVAGGAIDQGSDFTTVLFPLLKREELEVFLKKYLPDYVSEEKELPSLPKKSMIYYIARSFFPVLILSIILFVIFPEFVYIPFTFMIISIVYGWLVYKDSGMKLAGKKLTIRYRRGLSRRTIRIFQNRIQALEIKQHKLHLLHGLASVKVSIIATSGNGKHFTVHEAHSKDADRIFSWFSYQKI